MKSKIIISVLLSVYLASCGSKNATSTTSAPQPESAPITAATEQQTILLNQLVTQLEINHDEMEPIIEMRDVQTTCNRQQCHTEYEQQCSTHNDQICSSVQVPVCTNQSENVCRNVPDQVCHTEQFPVCQTIPRQVCTTQQVCETVNDQVCRGTGASRVCTNVPRRVCHAEQSCHTQNDQVCHTETRQKCEQITRRECHVETHQQCRNESRQECRNVPRQECHQVPRQACATVQFPCTQQEPVQVGERLRLHQLARVRVNLINPRGIDTSRDELLITLNNGMISAVARSATGIHYQVREASRLVNRLSATEELITVVLEVTVLF